MAKALDGIVVLDLTQYEAGPSCAQMLGWLGADVIKIEPPGGEPGRRMVSENTELDAWFFLMLNGNKKAVTLDLKAPEGRAILKRQSTGVGQRIEVAQQDAVLNLVRIHVREHYTLGKPVPRRGNRSPGGAPSNLYRCRPFGPNDYVFIHCATLEMWKTFSKILGRPELGDDPTLADRLGRVARNDELDALVEAWTEKRTKHEAMETLGAAGIPGGAVLDSGEVLTDPTPVERGLV